MVVIKGKKTVVSVVEKVEIMGKKFRARVDTGAQTSSIDRATAIKLGLLKSSFVRTADIVSASGRSKRKVVKTPVRIKDRLINASLTVADRSNLSFKVLIGRNILKLNFVVDCAN